jgi:hypothetical protein
MDRMVQGFDKSDSQETHNSNIAGLQETAFQFDASKDYAQRNSESLRSEEVLQMIASNLPGPGLANVLHDQDVLISVVRRSYNRCKIVWKQLTYYSLPCAVMTD